MGWEKNGLRAAMRRKTLRCWLMTAWHVHLQPRKPTISWMSSKETWPGGRWRWFSSSILLLLDPTWVLHPTLQTQHRKDVDLMEQVQRRSIKIIVELKHQFYEDRLGKLGLFSLDKRRIQEHLRAAGEGLFTRVVRQEGMTFNWRRVDLPWG